MPGTRTTGGDDMLRMVAAVLRRHDVQGWLVGGTVRDRELGCYSPDVDLAIAGDASSIAREMAAALGAPWFALSERHGAYRVVGRQGHVDFAAVRGDGILADLAERDFTVNAMAIPVGGGDPIDPFGGLADLKERRLTAVSDRIFADDPLRLMRAARFSHVLGLCLGADLRQAVQAQAGELTRAAPERVTTELVLTLAAGRAGDAVRLWQELGLLRTVIPELAQDGAPGEGEADEWSARGGGLGRDLVLLDQLEQILADLSGRFPDAAPLLERRLAESVDGAVERRVALRLAGLLRRLSPAQTQVVARRLKMSTALTAFLETAARMSRYPAGVPEATRGAPGTAEAATPAPRGRTARPGRATVLFLWAAAPWEPEVILLAMADAAAAAPPSGIPAAATIGAGSAADAPESRAGESARRLMGIWAQRAAFGPPRLPFDGRDLMRELGLAPGPRLGKALRAARLDWEAGEATTVEQALSEARAALDTG